MSEDCRTWLWVWAGTVYTCGWWPDEKGGLLCRYDVILGVGSVSAHVLEVKGGSLQPQGTKGHLILEPFNLDKHLGGLAMQCLGPRLSQQRNFQFSNGLLVLPLPSNRRSIH